MPENLGFDVFDSLFTAPIEIQQQHNASDNRIHSAKKARRLAEQIAETDKLRRQFEDQKQQLRELQRTANEVTEIYQREKQQRVELELRTVANSQLCEDLKQQLEDQRISCEQLQDQLHVKVLPIQVEDMVRMYMQRIGRDAHAGVTTRPERMMIMQLTEYCSSANISIPQLKKRTKPQQQQQELQPPQNVVPSRSEMCSIAVQTDDVPSRPAMCSIAVQTEKLSTRNQGIQHKNTTTTRATTTASLIQTNDVGTSCPYAKPAPNAQQILDEMLSWRKTPVSPICDPPDAVATATVTATTTTCSMGTCTDLCNVLRAIDFLPKVPATVKCSDSRPPSRGNYESVKDEMAMPTDLSGYSHDTPKNLLGFLPHNQSILAKMPPQDFEEIWQVLGKMILVALRHPTNAISQADCHSWFDELLEISINQPNNVACDSNNQNDGDEFTAASKKPTPIDIGTEPIKESSSQPKIGLELTPIRLPPVPKINPKTNKVQKTVPHSTNAPEQEQPNETAVHFLSNLYAYHKPNLDNLDIELDAEERQLLHLTTATLIPNQQLQNVPVYCEQVAHQLPQIGNAAVDSQKQLVQAADSEQVANADEHLLPSISNAAANSPKLPNAALDCEPGNPITVNAKEQRLPEICSSPVDGEHVAAKDSNQQLTLSLFGNDADSEDEEAEMLTHEQTSNRLIQIAPEEDAIHSDEDSIDDDHNLIIDEAYSQSYPCSVDDNQGSTPDCITMPQENDEKPAQQLHVDKRKRKSSSMCESQPVVKRFTRLQAKKQLLLESDNLKSEVQPSCIYDCSPMSPIATNGCEESEQSEPIEIPLEPPVGEQGESAPKALLCYVINSLKDGTKQRGIRKQQQQTQMSSKQSDQLKRQIIAYLKHPAPSELETCAQLVNTDDNQDVVINAIISASSELKDNNALEVLLCVLVPCNFKRSLLIERLIHRLEQCLFHPNKRGTTQLALEYVRLSLQLMRLQANLAEPLEYQNQNPARLLLTKILYHYNRDMTLLVLEVLSHFPTVLPHREERAYDNADPLITVIKHCLMCHKYEVQAPDGPDRALLSALRFQYHFQPFEPTRQQVITNLVEKLKAGHVHQLSYAFALFCKCVQGSFAIKDVLAAQLLPLVDDYCGLCTRSEEYDGRMECLLQCISMIVKQLPLDSKIDISVYIALFQQVLVAVPRPQVQQAAVQAILRTQRFGYAFALDALRSYRPNYPLTSMTRAMLRSFAERRWQYKHPH
ncbi:little elongation complex subunit 1 [Drosophila grimshawi]|uniref:GH20662 n=1 Tax=Drosophila grimshawi TaxID=7222 RepID=B4J7D4_DROGR|nr:little elongation complex subunit 1 [Drosophila grimshawi]EDW01058.1 GH20662 [Drosophila grimshawi]